MSALIDHIIHTSDGRLHPKASTTEADVSRIVERACKAQFPGGVVIHFHGGLVSEKSARESAEKKLYPLYADEAKAYPIFFVWESGFLEAPLNNLREIAGESLFRAFVKKAAFWALRKAGAVVGVRGAGGAPVDQETLNGQLDAWFSGTASEPPASLDALTFAESLGGSGSRGGGLDEDSLAEEIEADIQDDGSFQNALAATHRGIRPDGTPVPSTRGTGSTIAETSLLSKEAAERLFDTESGTTRGVVSFFRAAKAVAAIVIRCVRRARRGRGHGGYVTVVEETLRELYIDKLGREVWWERMKGDTADAFRDGPEYGGTSFLRALRAQLDAGTAVPKITLVGHSTGAIYICNFLRAANRIVPNLTFDVIFEAPALSHDVLAQTLAEHATRIRFFRSFGMSDELERGDRLVPILYPASLLYFVSGMLEREADLPLVGMQRFLREETFASDDFWSVEVCRKFFARHRNALVWSLHSEGPGLSCGGRSHADFDDVDRDTMSSVAHIIRTQ